MSAVTVNTLLNLASLFLLILGGLDVLQKESVWSRLWSQTRRLWPRLVRRLTRTFSTLWWYLRRLTALLLQKPTPPRTTEMRVAARSSAPTVSADLSVSYPDTATEITAIWESLHTLESRVAKTEGDSARALTDSLDKERSETQRRGWRAFKYVFAAALLQAGAIAISRL